MAVDLRDGQDLADALAEDVRDADQFLRVEVLGQRGRRSDERRQVRLRK